jgi:hypothetical protein
MIRVLLVNGDMTIFAVTKAIAETFAIILTAFAEACYLSIPKSRKVGAVDGGVIAIEDGHIKERCAGII